MSYMRRWTALSRPFGHLGVAELNSGSMVCAEDGRGGGEGQKEVEHSLKDRAYDLQARNSRIKQKLPVPMTFKTRPRPSPC
jgi:hypothetical protein